MLIGEIVRRTGLTKDTIRFYEKMNLIDVPKKSRRHNNYKEYPEPLVKKLIVIQKLKGFGFTLSEIQEMISLFEEDLLVCSDNIPMIKQKIKQIDSKINELTEIKIHLSNCIISCPGDCKVENTLKELKE